MRQPRHGMEPFGHRRRSPEERSPTTAPGVNNANWRWPARPAPEGGFVREILVREGDFVKEGQVLVKLDDGIAAADLNDIRAQIAGLEAVIAANNEQLPSLDEQLTDQRNLFTKGLTRKPLLLELERMKAKLIGDIAAGNERVVSLREQESKAQAKIGRNVVTAPQDGVVMNLHVHTVGGVIQPGGEILDLVPVRDKLVLEVKVRPLDIDVVYPDLAATVRFIAYKQRVTPTVEGKVTRVSADAVTDEQRRVSASGGQSPSEPYFLATIEVESDQLDQVPNVKLYPGMPVEAAIVTGDRTLLAFIAQPLTDSFARAFREE